MKHIGTILKELFTIIGKSTKVILPGSQNIGIPYNPMTLRHLYTLHSDLEFYTQMKDKTLGLGYLHASYRISV